MAIPEAQLNTWSNIGSQKQSSATYATVKTALERQDAGYNGLHPEIFLQGSYGNDTNIYSESDVDVVISYKQAWFRNLDALPPAQVNAYNQDHSNSVYTYPSFKLHVHEVLKKAFGADVTKGTKAFNIAANGSRRSADVIAAFEFHQYKKYNSTLDQSFDTGIGFLNSSNQLIFNYPKDHSANLTAKNQATKEKFKPTVRIFKNMRTRLVNDGVIKSETAPSYFIEGLLHNAPNTLFVGNYAEIVRAVLVWLSELKNRNVLWCAHRFHALIGEGNAMCWPDADAETFINASIKLWNGWS